MKIRDLFADWGFTNVKLHLGFAELQLSPTDDDRLAAWDLYVELVTRVTTQPLDQAHGTLQAALASVFSLFETTRQVLRSRGPRATQTARISVVFLNQVIRPFTARWHPIDARGGLDEHAGEFRAELRLLQRDLQNYSSILAIVAEVEDLTRFANPPDDQS